MADVFISYSRRDKDFVKDLHAALVQQNRDTWVDWEDIPVTADWWQEIERGIEAADTFVFVISSDSVTSKVCTQEIEHAIKHHKRLVPVVRRDDFDTKQAPEALRKHNWLFFRESDDFNGAFQLLIEAIDTDLEHVRVHTRLLVRAIEWNTKNRDDSFLLRGSDLSEAENWLTQCRNKEPESTSLQREYIQASSSSQEAQQILLAAGDKAKRMVRVGAGVMGIMLSIAAISAVLAQQRIQAANQEVQLARVEVTRTKDEAAQQTHQAQQKADAAAAKQTTAERKASQANAAFFQAKSSLEQVNQAADRRVATANQKVQTAAAQAQKAQQVATAAEHIKQKAQAEAQAAQKVVEEKTAALSQLDTNLKQAQYQINLSQQAIAESVGDTPARIAEQTGQKPAIIYASFIPTREDGREQDTDPLGLLLVTAEGQRRLQIPEATRAEVIKAAVEFRRSVLPYSSRSTFQKQAEQFYQWLLKPLEADLQKQKINNLVFLMDASLRSLPLSALYDGKQFLVERYSIGLMPGFTLTDARPANLKTAKILAMGISESTGDLPSIPGVFDELTQIMKLRQGKSFLNGESTLSNLKSQLQKQPFKIIHLATHAEFSPESLDKSFIQLWDTRLRMNQFDQLGFDNYPVELLVLSACRTAIGNKKSKFGFAGLAMQAGVRAVLASLWDVDDRATTALMTDFYRQLQTAPTKAEALRLAQLNMLRGRISARSEVTRGGYTTIETQKSPREMNYSRPYYWAGFTMIGNPW